MALRKSRALIVEDECEIGAVMKRLLENVGYDVAIASLAVEAIRACDRLAVEMILLDLGLPDANGRDVLSEVKARRPDAPVVIVSGRSDVATRVELLAAGADDYICKPFAIEELHARVVAVARRMRPRSRLSCSPHPVHLNPARRIISLDESEQSLTPTEFAIVWVLASRVHHVVPIGQLCDEVYGASSKELVVDCRAHITRTRQKLRDLGGGVRIQCTVGEGYALTFEDQASGSAVRSHPAK